jgi:hypothetical protein
MKQRRGIVVLVMITLVLAKGNSYAQVEAANPGSTFTGQSNRFQANEEFVLNEIYECQKWNQHDDTNVERLYLNLQIWAEFADTANNINVASAILNFPTYGPNVAEGKIVALGRLQRMSAVRMYLTGQLKNGNDAEKKMTARVMAAGGHATWQELEPIIRKYGLYDLTEQYKLGDAKPLLDSAIVNANWEGKIRAALVLEALGDNNNLSRVAEDIIYHAPVDSNRSNLRAIDMAISVAKRTHLTDCAKRIAYIAESGDAWIGPNCLSVLMAFANEDQSLESKEIIIEISKTSNHEWARQMAKAFLNQSK